MGKLNIAHHKSYHPYRRDNIERVRRDEEEAAAKEAKEEGRVVLADSEARLETLRERAGLGKGKGKAKEVDDMQALPNQIAKGSQGHINLFEDIEQQATITALRASKKSTPGETDKGVPLAPSAKDLRPWYSTRRNSGGEEAKGEVDGDKYKEEERRKRDAASKSRNDPLTAITHQLASRHPPPLSSARDRNHQSQSYSRTSQQHRDQPPPLNPTVARLTRESSERERALALIARKKREMAGSETPSTVRGDDGGGYGDVFNRREVEEAHRRRPRIVGWGDDGNGRRRGRW
ncbi:hypothetical protein BV22DRAFT_1035956 [Leucogyrophana mollusca]|uniref:Uncharacterized protein n=1 Tax=Leucogyrophana mollusca TaxID=85980 RepID=A0ACB8BE81_9AGAM|nr:hypothetical protein BV22DRAFT_1035956 [Leucogyrophana mollusca]